MPKSISLEKCKIILEKDGRKYTPEEVKAIKMFLTELAHIEYEIIKKVNINECINLHKGFNR